MSRTFEVNDKDFGKLTISYFDGENPSLESAALSELLLEQAIGWDCETTYAIGFEEDKQAGLDPYRTRIRLTQFATKSRRVYIFDHFKISAAVEARLVHLLESVLPVKIPHNGKFDVKIARHCLGVKRMGRIFDTELGFRLTQCGQYVAGRAGLAEVAQKLLGITLKKELQRSDWSVEQLTDDQLVYGAIDAYATLLLRDEELKTINDMELRFPASLDFGSIDPVASLELTGFPIVAERWAIVDQQMRAKRLDILEAIWDEFRASGVIKQQGLFAGAPIATSKSKTGIKRNTKTNEITSPTKIAKMLEAYGILLPKKTSKGKPTPVKTTSTPWLKPLEKKYKIIPLLLEFRELDKRKTSYGSDYTDKFCNPVTGRIHSDFDPLGAKTARFTDNKPNLQQIPHLDIYRSCFVAPSGWSFVGGDFSQIELRIAAELSGDAGYIEAFLSDEDFHAKTAELMFGLPSPPPKDSPEYKTWEKSEAGQYYKEMRGYAKRINFGIIYGMGAGKLAMQTDLVESKDVLRLLLLEREGIIENANLWLQNKLETEIVKDRNSGEFRPINKWEALRLAKALSNGRIEDEVFSTETAQDYLNKYKETFADLMGFLKECGKTTAENGGIRMASGRLVKFWVNYKDKGSVAQAERNGMNTPVQGLAGEILKIAMRSIFDRICEAGLQDVVKLCHTVHDELQLLVRNDYIDWAKTNLEECMVEAGQQFLKIVPVKADIKSGPEWLKGTWDGEWKEVEGKLELVYKEKS
jgi:DNA polymerase I-like protein with 3'-5' exonuclease and polymerase domains